jgi:hypothetical protein
MASGDRFTLFGAYNDTAPVAYIEMRGRPGVLEARAVARLDSGASAVTAWTPILFDTPVQLRLEWAAATAAGANNGEVRLIVGDGGIAALTGLDNDTLRVERGLLGAVTGVDTGTRGTIYFDEFTSSRW